MAKQSNDETGKTGAQAAPRSAGKCPICGKPRDEHYRPFCSKRCADVDLGRWFSGSYAIPVTEDADEDGEAAPPATEGVPGQDPDRE